MIFQGPRREEPREQPRPPASLGLSSTLPLSSPNSFLPENRTTRTSKKHATKRAISAFRLSMRWFVVTLRFHWHVICLDEHDLPTERHVQSIRSSNIYLHCSDFSRCQERISLGRMATLGCARSWAAIMAPPGEPVTPRQMSTPLLMRPVVLPKRKNHTAPCFESVILSMFPCCPVT